MALAGWEHEAQGMFGMRVKQSDKESRAGGYIWRGQKHTSASLA